MDGLEFLDAYVGVDGGGFELGVSEELLDVADVRAAIEHVRGAGVAEKVRASCAVDVGLPDVAGHLEAEHFGIEAFAVAGLFPRAPAHIRPRIGLPVSLF